MTVDTLNGRLSLQGEDLYSLILERIDGRPMRLARYWGQVLLVVNTASLSPLATQLQELESLHQRYGEAGLRIMGFPCNDFGGMEPGKDAEIQARYQSLFELNFALFTKARISMPPRHALFEMIARATEPLMKAKRERGNEAPATVLLEAKAKAKTSMQENFEKFLVSRDGQLLDWFPASVSSSSPELMAALENSLARPRAVSIGHTQGKLESMPLGS